MSHRGLGAWHVSKQIWEWRISKLFVPNSTHPINRQVESMTVLTTITYVWYICVLIMTKMHQILFWLWLFPKLSGELKAVPREATVRQGKEGKTEKGRREKWMDEEERNETGKEGM